MGLRERIMDEEGFRAKPYKDTVGKLTIGFGRNLEDVGVSFEEASMMLDNDLARTRKGVYAQWPWVMLLDQPRQDVVLDMAFNMGLGGLSTFKNFLAALQRNDYETAAREMETSVWAHQVGSRSVTLAAIMRSGPTEV